MRHLPAADPGVPDTRSPARYLRWLARMQLSTLAGAAPFGVLWMVAQALMPAAIGRAIDAGVTRRDTGALVGWAAVLLALGVTSALAGVCRHRFSTTNYLTAAYRTVQVTARHAARLGAVLPRRIATGEVVTVGASDINQLGGLADVVGRAAGSVVSFATVAAMARLLGVADVPADRSATGRRPDGERIVATGVRYAYLDGRDVLHGVDLAPRPGERLAVVGPSGAGKSTLGRLLAGIHGPRSGRVDVGGVGLVELPLGELRGHVALVTQEHHVFIGTVAENVALARPDAPTAAVRAALAAVDALDWVDALPSGADTPVGSGGHPLAAAQAQQLALARLVLADPHTLVLDEATSLIDPRALSGSSVAGRPAGRRRTIPTRHLERSLGAVLHGRTVVAIAHRLSTAHDADRVAVVSGGRVTELGPHDDLVAGGGEYAALWTSWHGRGTRLQ